MTPGADANYDPRTCEHPECNEEFIPKGARQRYCPKHGGKKWEAWRSRRRQETPPQEPSCSAPSPKPSKEEIGKMVRRADATLLMSQLLSSANRVTFTIGKYSVTVERLKKEGK